MTGPRPHDPPLTRRSLRAAGDQRAVAAAQAVEQASVAAPTEPLAVIRPGAYPAVFTPPTGRPALQPPITKPPPPPAAKPRQPREDVATPVQHARSRRATRFATALAMAAAGVLVLAGAAALTTAVSEQLASTPSRGAAAQTVVLTPLASALPVPVLTGAPTAALASLDLCAAPALTDALATHDDAAAVTAAGGAEAFRAAVAEGRAPCIPLDDPARVWVVVNKLRPLVPLDYAPPIVLPDGVRSTSDGGLRPDAAAALTAMVKGAAAAGVGEIALGSGYRSYALQETTHRSQTRAEGTEQAELSSARAGFSEHQSGLAADIVPCGTGCGTLDDLAGSPQGQWVAAHAWEYGWIVRYEAGRTDISGYLPEPWHLRFIGTDLARAYHDGGYLTLEEFFGLPPAPAYAG